MATTRFSGPVVATDNYIYSNSLPMQGPFLRSGLYYGLNSAAPEGASGLVLGNMVMIGFIVGKTTSFDRMGLNVTTLGGDATAVVRLGVYADNGFNFPGSLLLDAGVVPVGTQAVSTGSKENVISLTLLPGVYWLASAGQLITGTAPSLAGCVVVGVPNIGQAVPSATVMNGYLQTGVTAALPASPAAPTFYSNPAPVISLRVV